MACEFSIDARYRSHLPSAKNVRVGKSLGIHSLPHKSPLDLYGSSRRISHLSSSIKEVRWPSGDTGKGTYLEHVVRDGIPTVMFFILEGKVRAGTEEGAENHTYGAL